MKIDEYGAIAQDADSYPGNIGDSCAESSRFEHMKMLLGDYVNICNLENFVSPIGYVRHPTVPPEWAEKDFSGDQALPLYLAWRRGTNFTRTEQMKRRIVGNNFKTGNGDLISPGFLAELYDSQLLRTIALLGQIVAFKLPYRWSDGKKIRIFWPHIDYDSPSFELFKEINWFESSEGQVQDYLNYIHIAVYAPKWVRKLGPNKQELLRGITLYYRNERSYEGPNGVATRIVSLYEQVLEKYW